ncbi:MAG: glycosyltransferase family 4 protein [Armatimonadota bacterium]|nr:glycosyltransferase family 4 protein [Armatimonadota bacterium]
MLLLTDKFAPHRGGTAVVYTEWCRRLGSAVTVLTCAVPGADWRAFDAAAPFPVVRVPFINIPKLRYPLVWAAIYRKAHRLVRLCHPHVLHAGQVLETGLTCVALKRRFDIPFVVHLHGEEVRHYAGHPLTRRMVCRVLHAADAITANSRYTRELVGALGIPAERVSLVPPRVDAAPFLHADGQAIRTRHQLGNRPVLFTLGRLLERKGHDTVIRALPLVASRVPDVVYLVAGTGPRLACLRQLAAELGVGPRVLFTGLIPESEKPAYYAAADVFIHPNRQLPNGDVEGFGIVFLEANAAGKPVIGGDTGGTPDAILHGETGLLVDPTNVNAVAEAAILLLTNRELARRLGAQGRQRAVAEFTWENAVQSIRDLNEQVVAAHREARKG